MLRNVFAALAVPVSYGLIKYSATASIVTYAAHLTTSLNSHSFNKPTLFFLRFGAKVVDVLGSGVYNYYFREEIQEVGKVAGYYVEKYSPALIDRTLTYTQQFGKDYLVPITQSVVENVNYYITPCGIFVVTWVKDATTDVVLYALSSRFVEDVANFNAYLHEGFSINLYDFTKNSAYLALDLNEWLHEGSTINLYTLTGDSFYLAFILNEWLREGTSINLYTILSDISDFTIAASNFTYGWLSKFFEALIEWGSYFFEIFSELSNFYIDLTTVVEKFTELHQAFIEFAATPVFDLIGNYYITFLELCAEPIDLTFLAIYMDILAVKLMEIWNYPFDLTPEQLLNQLEVYKTSFMEWLDEPFDLTFEQILEQVAQFKEEFIKWWNEPSHFNEHVSFLVSTHMFKVVFIATGKVLFEDYIKSTFLRIILTRVIINELGEALRKTAEEVHSNHVAKNNLKAIDLKPNATDPNLLDKEESTELTEYRIPNLTIELSYNISMTEPNISTNIFCFYPTNISHAVGMEQLLPVYEKPAQKTVSYDFSFYIDNKSESAKYDGTLVSTDIHNSLSSSECFEMPSHYN